MPVVVITGASQGLGEAIALAFAREPEAQLALLARNIPNLEQVAAACRELGAEAEVFPCDVTDPDAVALAAGRVLHVFGTPDVLINNAGSFTPGTLSETTPASFRSQIDANLTSAFLITRAFLSAMQEQRAGLVLFMGSVASIRAYPSGAAYAAAKHGLLGLARSLREETKETGIRVTTLLPGATLTPSWAGTDLPDERFIDPGDVAAAAVAVYKMSPRAVVEELLIRPQLGDI